jgi:hypothetical protein
MSEKVYRMELTPVSFLEEGVMNSSLETVASDRAGQKALPLSYVSNEKWASRKVASPSGSTTDILTKR